ncbi:hypothetical protein [Glaciibacter psychrotolerans]|uniref:Pilus assembly protein CpaE n=1 Tax=Glaciibacter psychrotolerans TaxID=670054 RepID=A0A7Z0EEE8_9MICO|nr:hypothetical protein [Leifsonia psychrotolerans]NYJ19978.1 hypothetical protein [Leifsonia psychrotolerans]
MISIDVARALRLAGLTWHPVSGDFFSIERPGFENDVFTVSNMAIETHEFDTGTILGFNGTTEWALDSLALEDALWLPREDQLRLLLGRGFTSLQREIDDGPETFRVISEIHSEPVSHEASTAEGAYAAAVLALLQSHVRRR